MSFNKPIWWARDAVGILRQSGCTEHADAVLAVCERQAQLEAELAESRRIIEAERQGWKIALRTLLNEPQHAAIIGNTAIPARAEIDEIGEALVELSEARKDSERLAWAWANPENFAEAQRGTPPNRTGREQIDAARGAK